LRFTANDILISSVCIFIKNVNIVV